MMVMRCTRREFNRLSAIAGIACLGGVREKKKEEPIVSVAIVKTTDRESGIPRAVGLLGDINFAANDVYLKCSYNSPHPFPATTHPKSLSAAVKLLKTKGSDKITLVERSGMGLTRDVMEKLGAVEQIRELGISFQPLEELAPNRWKQVELPDSHWKRGIEAPRFLSQESCVVQVCNLRTHRFGGEFSAAIKNSIGLIAKYSAMNSQQNYMEELHASPHQCQMIAEVNQIYAPKLAIMDAVQAFIEGGPESGQIADSGIIAASRDRVALDATGIAILRHFGAGFPIDRGTIFEQKQIKRSAELGLGVRSARQIRLITEDDESRILASRLTNLLNDSPLF
jgi:uncharacterized protein (DUF362 family)